MVASCAACNRMEPWACSIVGVVAGIVYLALNHLLISLRIDDPLDAFAVHAGGGLWGMVSGPLLSKQGVAYAIVDSFHDKHYTGQAFAIGKLRVPSEIEMKGLDIYKHGEAAYPLYAYGHGWDDYEPLSRKTTRNRVMSFNQEISLEELAAAYNRRTTLVDEKTPMESNHQRRSIAFSTHYECPEVHMKNKRMKSKALGLSPSKLSSLKESKVRKLSEASNNSNTSTSTERL